MNPQPSSNLVASLRVLRGQAESPRPAKSVKVRQSAVGKYSWYLQQTRTDEPRPLKESQKSFSETGLTAIECFHLLESQGLNSPCREPLLLERYIQGKMWHGVLIEQLAESMFDGTMPWWDDSWQAYPDWVKNEVLQSAKRLSLKKHGFVLGFLSRIKLGPTQRDLSIIP